MEIGAAAARGLVVGVACAVGVAEVGRAHHRRGHRDVDHVHEQALRVGIPHGAALVVAVLDVEEVVGVAGRDEHAERGGDGVLLLRVARGTRGERHVAGLGDLGVGGDGHEGVVDRAAVRRAGGPVGPGQGRGAGHAVVLLRGVVEVGRAEAVAEFVDDRAAIAGEVHLRDRVGPERVGPGNGRPVALHLVHRAGRELLRRGFPRVVRADPFLHHLRVAVHVLAVDVARVGGLLHVRAGRLDVRQRVRAQFRRAGPAVALEPKGVREGVVPAVVAERVRGRVDGRVRRQDGPRDALRVVLVVVGDRAAVHLREAFAHGLGGLRRHAVREGDDHEVDLELAALRGRGALGRERRGGPPRRAALAEFGTVFVLLDVLPLPCLRRHGVEERGGEGGGKAGDDNHAGVHG